MISEVIPSFANQVLFLCVAPMATGKQQQFHHQQLYEENRIIGGAVASPQEFPWLAHLTGVANGAKIIIKIFKTKKNDFQAFLGGVAAPSSLRTGS